MKPEIPVFKISNHGDCSWVSLRLRGGRCRQWWRRRRRAARATLARHDLRDANDFQDYVKLRHHGIRPNHLFVIPNLSKFKSTHSTTGEKLHLAVSTTQRCLWCQWSVRWQEGRPRWRCCDGGAFGDGRCCHRLLPKPRRWSWLEVLVVLPANLPATSMKSTVDMVMVLDGTIMYYVLYLFGMNIISSPA